MRSHELPSFSFNFQLQTEIKNLEKHQEKRKIPERTNGNVIIATWNLTNFGVQKRTKEHLKLMSEILRPFDIIAVQEIADDLEQFNTLLKYLGNDWNAIYTDTAGNDERLAFIYNTQRVITTGLSAELALLHNEEKVIKVKVGEIEEEAVFNGFNRNPFMMSFLAGSLELTIVNVHLYWTDFTKRILEAKALAKWAKSRVNCSFPPNNDIVLIGDFNMPRVRPGDEIYDQMKSYGLKFPKHETELIGSNLAGDKDYDELGFFPTKTEEDFSGLIDVFDFDKALFPDLWDQSDKEKQKQFFQYIRYYIADHRPIWAEFKR